MADRLLRPFNAFVNHRERSAVLALFLSHRDTISTFLDVHLLKTNLQPLIELLARDKWSKQLDPHSFFTWIRGHGVV